MSLRFVAASWILASSLVAAPCFAQAESPKPAPAQTPAKRDAQSKPASAPSDPRMTAEERAKVVRLMRESEKKTLEAIDGLTDAQWTFKPAPEKWSIGEVVEHIALAEVMQRSMLERTLAGSEDADWSAKQEKLTLEMLEKGVLNRDTKFKAPEPAQPTGKLTRAEATKRLKEGRAKSIEYAEKTDARLKAHVLQGPPFDGMNMYLLLALIPLHNTRHNAQIAEVKSNPGYPAK